MLWLLAKKASPRTSRRAATWAASHGHSLTSENCPPSREAANTGGSQITRPKGGQPAASGAAHPAAPEELTIGQERVVELISFVVVNLVDHPQDVTIDIARSGDRDIYRLKVHPEDLGKVIGKGGQTARALRTLLSAVSARTDQRIGLDIVE